MIRYAEPDDHPQIKALWREAFGDPVSAIEVYFQSRHEDKNMLVDVRKDAVAGMLSMLPVTFVSGNQSWPARYLYAIATRESLRGQGIGTELLNAAHAYMRNAGEAASVLVPGNQGLFTFYEKRGYKTAFVLDELTVTSENLPPLPPDSGYGECSAKEYARLRDLAFSKSSLYVRWEEQAVAYAVRTFAKPGCVFILHWANGYGCAAWEETENGILVRELALPEGRVYDALAVLHHALHAERYTVRLREGTVSNAAVKPFGMLRWMIPEPTLAGGVPYLSLAMD